VSRKKSLSEFMEEADARHGALHMFLLMLMGAASFMIILVLFVFALMKSPVPVISILFIATGYGWWAVISASKK